MPTTTTNPSGRPPAQWFDSGRNLGVPQGGRPATPPNNSTPDNPSSTAQNSPSNSQVSLVDLFKNGLANLPYYNTPAFQNLVSNFASDPNRTLINPQNSGNWQQIIQGYANTFATQFKNASGREPTPEEYNTFFEQVVNPMQPYNKTPDQAQIDQGTSGLLKNAFSSTITDAAQTKATDQATAAVAPGSAFDQWQKSYTSSVNDVEKSLQDYQSRLFEKIRPQLLTSLQSQGLLDTGGLNEAFSGVAGDLASAGQNFVANARANAATDVANRKFAIQSAPTNFALSNTFNTVPDLTQSGQTALQNAWNSYMTTNASNLNFNNNEKLLNEQYANQPSLLSQYGGLILGGVASGAGRKLMGG